MNMKQVISVGVGAVVFRDDDEVLIIKRGKEPFLGAWSIPGGGLHYGEKLEDAAIREVREETGLEIQLVGLLGAFDGLQSDEEQDGFTSHTVIIDYVAEWVSGEPVAGDDAAEAEFVSIEKAISRMSWDVTRQAIGRAVKIRDAARKGS
ncbi:MAG: DNA mismatch repair protein MutT [Hyphococcus sp.]|nr:MAG: DNA mismatch repair protein MutT [Marinicaulis sp.]